MFLYICASLLEGMPNTAQYLALAECDTCLFDDERRSPPRAVGEAAIVNDGVLLRMAKPATTILVRRELRQFVNDNGGDYIHGLTGSGYSGWIIYFRLDAGPSASELQQLWLDFAARWDWQVTRVDA